MTDDRRAHCQPVAATGHINSEKKSETLRGLRLALYQTYSSWSGPMWVRHVSGEESGAATL
jgi:hypothetical protein